MSSEWDSWKSERPVADYTRADGVRFKPGDRVRLRPGRRADVLDLALAGRTAVIATVEQDFEGQFYFTVTVGTTPAATSAPRGAPRTASFSGRKRWNGCRRVRGASHDRRAAAGGGRRQHLPRR
jgi:hypothetical protein